jgi:hypothetical protein
MTNEAWHQISPSQRSCNLPPTITTCQRSERHRKHLHVIPEILAGQGGTNANVGAPAIRQSCLGIRHEARMPKSEQNARGKLRFPIRLLSNDGMHELEETVRVVLRLDIDIEIHVLILGLAATQREMEKR